MRWLVANGWCSNFKLSPKIFPDSGRGLMAREPIKAGDTIVKIPSKLLITVSTVSSSGIGHLFDCGQIFSTQQVLAAYLVWEKHLGRGSFWDSYISLLPSSFNSPLFCSEDQLIGFPLFIRNKVNEMKTKLDFLFEDLLIVLSSKVCYHCNRKYSDFYTKNDFMWAWFIVNSRAVYISPSHNNDHTIKLCDDNSLALAPYLDMLNHSDDAKVQAYLLEQDGTYCLRTLVGYRKYEEVFIHYGSHSNLKLYLEYGFVLPENKNDVVSLDFSELLSAISSVFRFNAECSSYKYKMLKSHDMLKNLYLNADGFSWNVKVVIYVLLCPSTVELKSLYRKIFSDGFSPAEVDNIILVGKHLASVKSEEMLGYLRDIESLCSSEPNNESLQLCLDLLNHLSGVLNKCMTVLENSSVI
ncbi:hypothetical protein AAG570_011081 [Ranatra chinensis]|uniref:SET domain-containing protein n=1 Tax=Ranatra chinensis TaxID=642074 RepID=A0ABD0YLQ8_9HEMI